MKAYALLLLRMSLGLLMLFWGADKIVNVEHGLQVSEGFYFGLFTSAGLLRAFGWLQCALGLLIVLGAARRFCYVALLLITGMTLVGVWRSVIDPWEWYLEGGNVLFFPSLIIFAAALVLHAFRTEDLLSLDQRGARA
jgi:putative oxidoreductase